ncbi:hypothetical protein Tco_1113360 [Tanacetum coccineum]|uniref:Uncharacterized protein n=1 Tax=Tanacetum coccineum TaxID=301880 RepID=A0ABQ5IS15_9ASTR
MSRANYNIIKEKPFQARRNPYQPYKFCNFVGRAKNMHIFIGCFVYVVDFMILEDLGSIIDSGLSEVVLGKSFALTSKLTYDESLGLIRFAQKDDEVMFRMPYRTKELDLVSPLEKDKFEAFFMDSLKGRDEKKRLDHLKQDLRRRILAVRLRNGITGEEGRRVVGPAPSYVHIRDPVRRLCHRMIACTISGRGQGARRHAEGERVETGYLEDTLLDSWLIILVLFKAVEDDSWVAAEGAQADPTPAQAPTLPPPVPQPRIMSQRIERVKEEMF